MTSPTKRAGADVPVAYAREHDAAHPSYYDVVLPDSQEAEMWAYDLLPLYSGATIAALQARIAELEARNADLLKLQGFAAAMLDWDMGVGIGDVDGGVLQDLAEHHGLLVPVQVSEACGEMCLCADYGYFPQTCYRKSETLKRAFAATKADAQAQDQSGEE